MIRKVGIVAVVVAAITAALALIPLPLLQWAEDIAYDEELLDVLDARYYGGARIEHVFPVPGVTDRVVVCLPAQVWLYVGRSRWGDFSDTATGTPEAGVDQEVRDD